VDASTIVDKGLVEALAETVVLDRELVVIAKILPPGCKPNLAVVEGMTVELENPIVDWAAVISEIGKTDVVLSVDVETAVVMEGKTVWGADIGEIVVFANEEPASKGDPIFPRIDPMFDDAVVRNDAFGKAVVVWITVLTGIFAAGITGRNPIFPSCDPMLEDAVAKLCDIVVLLDVITGIVEVKFDIGFIGKSLSIGRKPIVEVIVSVEVEGIVVLDIEFVTLDSPAGFAVVVIFCELFVGMFGMKKFKFDDENPEDEIYFLRMFI